MKEFTIKIDMSEFATKEDFERFATKDDLAKLDDTFHSFAERILEILGRIENTMATKEDLRNLEINHGTRIEILEDEMKQVKKTLAHA